MPGGVRVIKLGGSLLGTPSLAERFRAWLREQSPLANVVVVGGGTIVEKLRELDHVHGFAPNQAHWLAIQAMSVTAGVVADALGDAPLVPSLDQLRLQRAGVEILDVEQFMRDDAGGDDPLPESWDVTSDSIAARLAARLGADELVLLKSACQPPGSNWTELAAAGYVDVYFPRAAAGLQVRCECLAHKKGERQKTFALMDPRDARRGR